MNRCSSITESLKRLCIAVHKWIAGSRKCPGGLYAHAFCWLVVRYRPVYVCVSVRLCEWARVYAQFPKRGFSRVLLFHPSGWTDGVLWLRSPCMKDGLDMNHVRGVLYLCTYTLEKLLPNGAIQTHLHPLRLREAMWIHGCETHRMNVEQQRRQMLNAPLRHSWDKSHQLVSWKHWKCTDWARTHTHTHFLPRCVHFNDMEGCSIFH